MPTNPSDSGPEGLDMVSFPQEFGDPPQIRPDVPDPQPTSPYLPDPPEIEF